MALRGCAIMHAQVFSLSLELFLGPCSLVTADEDPESSIDDGDRR